MRLNQAPKIFSPGLLLGRVWNAVLKRALLSIGGPQVLTLQLDLTNACNLKCVHCYHPHHRNDGAISLNDWLLIIEQYKSLLNRLRLKPDIILCGGEPMLSPHLMPVLKAASDIPEVRFSILTNGTVHDERRLSLIRPFAPYIQISFDGPDATTHDLIRGSGNFVRAAEGVRKMKAMGLRVGLLAVLSHRSSQSIDKFFKLASSLGVDAMSFTRLITEGAATSLVEEGLDRPLAGLELRGALEEIVKQSRKWGVATDTYQPLYHLIDPLLGSNGRIGFQGLVVDFQGRLKVASRTSPTLGDLRQHSMGELFLKSPLMKSLRNGSVEVCGDCAFYSRCGGSRTSAFAATGNFLAADPGCWLTAEERRRL